ncbi:hypothetical protein JTE90_021726 [Oedothorax gibbosus]|uniref:TTF-type domain-containing protein n=1 Tax=Oedothorax gibbosus TaxID=931172 RepID=A0AAV6UFI1_9ARAC|nr:hypothetical protein JTE90_021726 [Oedothorax gibbosus]
MVNEILDENPESFGNPMNAGKIVNDREKAYIRHFPENIFFILKADGTKEKREWHFYSETSDSAFCYVCKIFSKTGSQFSTRGCSDWKNISRRICEHKRSLDHRQSMFDFSKRSQQKGLIDTELIKQFENERQYWRDILKRVVATVKFLSSLGLAFRGNNESEGEGNYFSCLKYLAEFEPFLASHIKRYANHGQGSQVARHYLQQLNKPQHDLTLNWTTLPQFRYFAKYSPVDPLASRSHRVDLVRLDLTNKPSLDLWL